MKRSQTDAGDEFVDPTGALNGEQLRYIQENLDKIVATTHLPAYNWGAHWFAGLKAAEQEVPGFSADEALGLDWAFRVETGSNLHRDEQVTPGITEYIGHLMGRTAVLANQTVTMFREQYEVGITLHLGVETSFALTRTLIELIGRARSLIVPASQGKRVKAYVAAKHYDLTNAQRAMGTPQPGLAELEALVPTLEPLDGHPSVHRRVDKHEPPLQRWRVHSTAYSQHLTEARRARNLYQALSEAVHGGGFIAATWFADGQTFGPNLVKECVNILRHELTALNYAYLAHIAAPSQRTPVPVPGPPPHKRP